VELIEELHRAASEAAMLGFPGMARCLDECGFSFASRIGKHSSDQRALIEHARRCLAMWRALLDWASLRGLRE
jgi:hypothetical protein